MAPLLHRCDPVGLDQHKPVTPAAPGAWTRLAGLILMARSRRAGGRASRTALHPAWWQRARRAGHTRDTKHRNVTMEDRCFEHRREQIHAGDELGGEATAPVAANQ